MAKPYLKRGTWYVRVKDVLGWRSIAVPEARTKAEANRHAADLAMRLRRQRDGLEPLPSDRSLTLGELLEWWLENNSARMPSHRRTEGRYRTHFRDSELARLQLAALTSGRIEVFRRPLFATAIYTGLRKGELLGLRKKDVDLQRRLLTVGRRWAVPALLSAQARLPPLQGGSQAGLRGAPSGRCSAPLQKPAT
jgi:integrase